MLFDKISKKKKLKKLYKTLSIESVLCFDIGANLGYKSLILLESNNKVVAFEPQTNCQIHLDKISKKNTDFIVEQLAIGSENSESELFIGNHIEIATLSNKFIEHFRNENIYWNQKEQVKIVTLDSQIEKYGIPEFCKIDAEGSEYDILKKLSYRIQIIEFEFTGGFIEETMLCINKISSLGDYKFNYILNEKPELKLEKWVSNQEISSLIKALKPIHLHGNIFAKVNS